MFLFFSFIFVYMLLPISQPPHCMPIWTVFHCDNCAELAVVWRVGQGSGIMLVAVSMVMAVVALAVVVVGTVVVVLVVMVVDVWVVMVVVV